MTEKQQADRDGEQGKIELIAIQRVSSNGELYKIVDFLNKNLKGHKLMFGLSKKEDDMVISVYEVE